MVQNRTRIGLFLLFSSSLVFAHPGHSEDESFFPVIFFCLLSLAIPLVIYTLGDSIRKCKGPVLE